MPIKKPVKKENGRPKKPIDWELVDRLLMAGCTGTQICPHFDLCADVFYTRVHIEKGIGFTEYQQLKRSKGDSLLLEKQFEKALKGDNSMLVWLGKNRLKQRDTPMEDTVSEEIKANFESLMAATRQLQDLSERKSAEINNSEESKS